MTVRRLLPAAVAATLGLTATASAAVVSAPAQLAAGSGSLAATSATDAAGRTTAVINGRSGGPVLRQRAVAGDWGADQPLPGAPAGVAGPVAAAAGDGALAIAWRVDRPRRYAGIAALLGDPGQPLATPAILADDRAGGTRHPAVALNASGQAIIAYNTGTRAVHLSMRGRIAVALRRAGGAPGTPVIVDDAPSVAPAVALAADGTGVVAWARRQRIYVVSVDVGRGRIVRVQRIVPPDGASAVAAAAGPGGAATLAWRDSVTVGKDDTARTYNDLQAVRRLRGGAAFGPAQRLTRTRDFIGDIVLVADEQGATTAAWAEDRFGEDRGIGQNGVVSAIRQAAATSGARAFAETRTVAPRGEDECSTPALAARHGVVAMAWECLRRGRATLRVAVGPVGIGGAPTIADTIELGRRTLVRIHGVSVGLDDEARFTAVYVRPDGPAPGQSFPAGTAKVLAVSGR